MKYWISNLWLLCIGCTTLPVLQYCVSYKKYFPYITLYITLFLAFSFLQEMKTTRLQWPIDNAGYSVGGRSLREIDQSGGSGKRNCFRCEASL